MNSPSLNGHLAAQYFARQYFVLVQPSHPGNVGAAARAIKNMGFDRLVLVQPLQDNIQTDPVAVARASGAADVLALAKVVDHIDDALTDATLTIALSARAREFSPQICDPRTAAAYASTTLIAHRTHEVAWIFGNERYGLPNDITARCRLLVHIPSNPAYSSLNLAQAIQLLAYEARLALTGTSTEPYAPTVGFTDAMAPDAQIEAMFEHLEQALIALAFLDPSQPKKLIPRLRRLFSRSHLEVEEVNILRGIARAILQHAPTSHNKLNIPGNNADS